MWIGYAKGGELSPYYSDVELVLNAADDLAEIKAALNHKYPYLNGNLSWVLHPENDYFAPGLTFGQRTTFLRTSVLPEGCYFSVAGKGIFGRTQSSKSLLQSINTPSAQFLIYLRRERLSLDPQFQEGDVSRMPWPDIDIGGLRQFEEWATESISTVRTVASFNEIDHAFKLVSFETAAHRAAVHAADVVSRNELAANALLSSLLNLSSTDFEFIDKEIMPRWHSRSIANWFEPREIPDTISFALGTAFGRWDIRYATGEQAAPELPDPFAPLPVCPPGQLQNAQGLPVGKAESGKLKAENYPIEIPWDGILVDDPNHPLDLERRVREVIEIIWSGQSVGPTAEAIEHEACEILGVKSLRDYFRKPAGFFADHLKRYSKSRRQAPIYWPLGTPSGSYTLWIYYHRLTPDTLYKCLQDFVEPKIAELEKDLHRLRTMLAADEAGTRERKQLAEAETLLDELRALHADLTRWAPRWKPNLNDGVQITASPLWKLFLLPKWQKTLKETWQALEKGDYDWAHLAHSLWPDRVREKCKKDRSLAIAHNLEDLCEIQAPVPKKRAAKKAAKKKGKDDNQPELIEEG
jgi:hypothetical protein